MHNVSTKCFGGAIVIRGIQFSLCESGKPLGEVDKGLMVEDSVLHCGRQQKPSLHCERQRESTLYCRWQKLARNIIVGSNMSLHCILSGS